MFGNAQRDYINPQLLPNPQMELGSSQESAYKLSAHRLLAENRRLQKEVRELRQKLEKTTP